MQPVPNRLHQRLWPRQTDEAVATLLCVHGLGEHSGRYRRLAAAVGASGIDVLAIDLVGHGRSYGPRGHARDFERDHFGAVEELLAGADAAALPGPRVLLGHSLGGLIAMRWVQERADPDPVRALVLLSPWIESRMAVPLWKRWAARAVSGLVPGFSLLTGIKDEELFRDPLEVADYAADPLVQRRMSAGHWVAAVAEQRHVVAKAGSVGMPVLMQVAGDDRIASTEASLAVAARLTDVTVHEYAGAFHALHADSGVEQVYSDLIAWVRERVAV
jgi:alpha-beta hydrolase superfamily lysophospholipase